MGGHQMSQKDLYNFILMTGGRKNKYYSSLGDDGKPGKPLPQGGGTTGHNHNDDEDDYSDDDNDDQHEQSYHPPQQGPLQQPAPGAYAYQYQRPPPPPYQNQLAVGDYHHAPGYPVSTFVPHQGGYENHGGGHMNDAGLVGAAIGIATFGVFQLMRDHRGHGGRRRY